VNSTTDNVINIIINKNIDSNEGKKILVRRRKHELKNIYKKMKLMCEIQTIYTENTVLRNISHEKLKKRCETLYYLLRHDECCVCYGVGVKFKKANCKHKVCEECFSKMNFVMYTHRKSCPICRELIA
jgi:hypothetical protein